MKGVVIMSTNEFENFIKNKLDIIQQNNASLIFRENVRKNIDSTKMFMEEQRKILNLFKINRDRRHNKVVFFC